MYLEKLENYLNNNLKYDNKESVNHYLSMYLPFFLKDDTNLNNIELKYDDFHKSTYIYLYFDNCNVTCWFREKYCCSLNIMFTTDQVTIKSGLFPKFGVEYIDGDYLYQFGINATREDLLNTKNLSVTKLDIKNGMLEFMDVDISKLNEEHNMDIIYQIIEDIKSKNKNNLVRNRQSYKIRNC